jgi:hypothetical protein
MGNGKHRFPGSLLFAGLFFLFLPEIRSQNSFDSLKARLPRHYFNTVVVLDAYRKPDVPFKDTMNRLSKRLKSYGIKQLTLSFHVPLLTTEKTNADSSIRNTHLLLTGNYMSLRPLFDGLSQHNLVKFGIGMRYIYNTGKKGVWFVDVSPFVTRDVTYPSKPYYRLASTIVYSHNVNYKFNWRLGVTKSFLWGNRFYLPFIGIRVGRLDKTNISIQFPRSASLNIPLGSKLIFSLYTRPQGGMFNFSNRDSLYFKNTDATFHFTRYEINSGFRVDVRLGSHFNFYVSSGLSSKNNITFYSENANKSKRFIYDRYFYSKNVAPTLFINFGLVLKFGKTRSYYNNRNIYDAVDINNTVGTNTGNAQIPLTPKRKKTALNLKSVQDLVDYNDF